MSFLHLMKKNYVILCLWQRDFSTFVYELKKWNMSLEVIEDHIRSPFLLKKGSMDFCLFYFKIFWSYNNLDLSSNGQIFPCLGVVLVCRKFVRMEGNCVWGEEMSSWDIWLKSRKLKRSVQWLSSCFTLKIIFWKLSYYFSITNKKFIHWGS